MRASGRSSDRVVDPWANHLVRGSDSPTKGADDVVTPLTPNHAARVSRQQLTRIVASLSDRDFELLRALDRLHFLTSRQVERLLFPVGPLTPLGAARSSRRVLGRLTRLDLIDRLERRVGGVRAGSASYVYCLSPVGARVLKHPTRKRSREPGLTHLDHVLAVSELVVQLHEGARTGEYEVITVETEPDCWRPIIAPHGGRRLLKPDLRLVLGVADQELHWFVEMDRGGEHGPVLAGKCKAYWQAWRDGRIESELGVFPKVVWIVPNTRRAQFVSAVIDDLEGVPSAMFVVTLTTGALTSLRGGGP